MSSGPVTTGTPPRQLIEVLTMPVLFQEVELVVDCRAIEPPLGSCHGLVVPRGTRGFLVDQNSVHPNIWIIEFPEFSPPEMVLGEVDERSFVVCGPDPPAHAV